VRLAAPSRVLPPPPRFTFGPFPPSLMAMYYRHWGLSSCGVFKLSGFELTGGFLLSSGGMYYRCPELNIHEAHIKQEVERIAPGQARAQKKHLLGSYVVLAGPGHNIYGHWLVEYLPKISLLNFAGFNLGSLGYLVPATVPRFVFAWLELLGIGDDQIVRYQPQADIITADEFLLPTILHNGVRMSPIFKDAVAFMRGLVESRHDLSGSPHGSRVFLARPRQSASRALSNRVDVEDAAARANFSLIYPEQLSLVEQIRLFVGCREIMGEYGSALHGSVFSPAGTVVCALRGPFSHPGFIQSGIGDALSQPTGYIFGEADDHEVDFGFQIVPETLELGLKLVFNSGLSL
jgi:capsular polysaccharide biosynthesis protein